MNNFIQIKEAEKIKETERLIRIYSLITYLIFYKDAR